MPFEPSPIPTPTRLRAPNLPVPVPTVLNIDALTRAFGDLVAVDHFSLDVVEGEVLALLGPNGAGKTTLISMICGLLAPTFGKASLRGELLGPSSPARTRIGVCPQELVLWPELTCLEQLVLVARLHGIDARSAHTRALALLEQLGLGPRARARAATLSGGMQRRLNLALALVHGPEVVVLDEPLVGLDPQARILVRNFIRSLANGHTVLLTTHDMDEADRIAHRVTIMDHGRRVAVGTPLELKRRFGGGDVLELTLPSTDPIARTRAINVAGPFAQTIGGADDLLILSGLEIAERLPHVVEALDLAGLPPREVRLRNATLEDVFIALTGRSLRE